MSESELKQLLELFGINIGQQNDISLDAIGNWFNQITTVLLIVFIIAFVLFAGAAQAAIKDAEAKTEFWYGQFSDINDTTVGKEVQKRNNALIDLQKEKLRVALEKVEIQERTDFGISIFAPRDANGKINYRMNEVLSGSKVISELFKDSCIRAKESLSDQKLRRQEWYERVLQIAALQNSDSSSEEQAVDKPQELTPGNAEWLIIEIQTRTEAVYIECLDIQSKAVSYLSDYYSKHTGELSGLLEGLNEQLIKAVSPDTPDGEKQGLISSFSSELQRQIKSLFEKQGVPLLSSI
jgi:hypothetical protein